MAAIKLFNENHTGKYRIVEHVHLFYQLRRNRRLSAAYNGFVASHYDPQSGEAIFVSNSDEDNGLNLDDDDAETPLITGFADDEPLIVA